MTTGNEQTVAFLTWLYQQALDDIAARAERAGRPLAPTLAVSPDTGGYKVAIEIFVPTETAAALIADELTV